MTLEVGSFDAAALTVSSIELQGGSIADLDREFDADPLGFLTSIRDRYGDVSLADDGAGERWFFVFSPALIADILQMGVRTHRALLRSYVGDGLFAVPSGSVWRQRRSAVGPLLDPRHGAYDPTQIPQITNRILGDALASSASTEIDLGALLQRVCNEVIVTIMAPHADEAEVAEVGASLGAVLSFLDRRVNDPSTVGKKDEAGFWKQREIICEFIDRWSSAAEPEGHGSGFVRELGKRIGSRSWEAVGEGEAALEPHDVLRDEILSACVAGVETTGAFLAWAFWFLAQNEDIRQRVVEISKASVAAGDREPDAFDEDQSFVRAVLLETLRLAPPAWALRRVMPSDLDHNGVSFKKDDVVWMSQWVTHRDPRFWPDPEEFDPSRFDGPPAKGAFFPFAGGPHTCPGQELTLRLGQEVLRAVYGTSSVAVDVDRPAEIRPRIALSLHPSLRARMESL